MSLTQTDLQEIKNIVSEVMKPLNDEVLALRNDIKDIYNMISELQTSTITDKKFNKLTLEKKLLTLNAELLATAKQAGVTLPRS